MTISPAFAIEVSRAAVFTVSPRAVKDGGYIGEGDALDSRACAPEARQELPELTGR
jgi:hypothetical protein